MPTVMITGANRGIGLAFARAYAGDGWRVLAACRTPETAHELNAVAGDVAVHRLDVTDPAQINKVATALAGEPIDVVINNAGVFGRNDRGVFHTGVPALDGVDPELWERVLRVNTIGPFRVACAFLPNLHQGSGKRLVALSSGYGSLARNTGGGLYPYRTSKAAVNMVVRGLATDLAGFGVIAVALDPGWVRTDMGGPSAPIAPEESVRDMRRVIADLTPSDSGKFLNRHGGENPW